MSRSATRPMASGHSYGVGRRICNYDITPFKLETKIELFTSQFCPIFVNIWQSSMTLPSRNPRKSSVDVTATTLAINLRPEVDNSTRDHHLGVAYQWCWRAPVEAVWSQWWCGSHGFTQIGIDQPFTPGTAESRFKFQLSRCLANPLTGSAVLETIKTNRADA